MSDALPATTLPIAVLGHWLRICWLAYSEVETCESEISVRIEARRIGGYNLNSNRILNRIGG